MPNLMKLAAAGSLAAAIAATVLFCRLGQGIYLTLAVTFGTVAYHLLIRLIIGMIYSLIMNNKADYTGKWYRSRPWEESLYKLLRVKSWKDRMPTYSPETFSREKHSWDDIAQAMCQSELVHETNVIFSFVPLVAAIWFGSFEVFLITSVCGGILDLLFAIMQRYNRPRVIRLAAKENARHENR